MMSFIRTELSCNSDSLHRATEVNRMRETVTPGRMICDFSCFFLLFLKESLWLVKGHPDLTLEGCITDDLEPTFFVVCNCRSM